MLFCSIAGLFLAAVVSVDALRRVGKGHGTLRAIDDYYDLWPMCDKTADACEVSSIMNELFYYSIDVVLETGGVPTALLLDTGSGESWVNGPDGKAGFYCNTSQQYTNAAFNENSTRYEPFNISYLDDTGASGRRFPTQIGINSWPTSHTLGIANTSDQCIGILGIGYFDHDKGGVRERKSLVRNLLDDGRIQREAYSLYPHDSDIGGSVLFGAVNNASFDGHLTTLPMGSDYPTINITNITISDTASIDGELDVIFDDGNISAVLDIGSVLTYLPEREVVELVESYEIEYGSVVVSGFGESEIHPVNCSWRDSERFVNFTFSSVSITVPSRELVLQVPREYEDDICVFGIASTEYSRGQSILGYTFLRSAYAVFDLNKSEVHLAQYKSNADVADESHPITMENGVPFTSAAQGFGQFTSAVPVFKAWGLLGVVILVAWL